MTGIEEAESFAAREVAGLGRALEELGRPPYPRLLADVAETIEGSLRRGGKVMFCGNGGSAADAQHLAAELVGRQNHDRPAAAGLALTVDTSVLTALANDFGYETVFSRQVEALGRPGDVLMGLSTSGRSPSVVKALDAACQMGITTLAFAGRDPRQMARADLVVAVPASETGRVQELHIVCGHIVFALVERGLFSG